MARLGRLVRDQPMRPVEKAVWWTEYVIRHGGADHYRYPAAHMSFLVYHYYDVVGAAVLLAIALLAALHYLAGRLFRWFVGAIMSSFDRPHAVGKMLKEKAL